MTATAAPFSLDLRAYDTARLRALLDGTAAELAGGDYLLAHEPGDLTEAGIIVRERLNRVRPPETPPWPPFLPGLDRQSIHNELNRRAKAEHKAAEKARKAEAAAALTFSDPETETPTTPTESTRPTTTPFTTTTEPETEEVAAAPPVKRGPGRPKGSRNRSTLERLAREEAARAAEEAAALEAAAKDSTTATPI